MEKKGRISENLCDSALMYEDVFQFSVIPIRPDKKPYIPWGDFQKMKATKEEIRKWWERWPKAMIGIVTGKVSNLLVIDCDTQQGYSTISDLIPNSITFPVVRTPREGWHLYFAYPKQELTVGTGIMPGVDYRGEGGYIIAPPSVTGEGKKYRWEDNLSIADVPLPPLPDALYKFLGLPGLLCIN